jgi:hypothetical protein
MANKIDYLFRVIGWTDAVEMADSLANALLNRLPLHDAIQPNSLFERQIDFLLTGLASRRRRHQSKWGLAKKIAFQHLLQVKLQDLGYEVDFSTIAAQRIARY